MVRKREGARENGSSQVWGLVSRLTAAYFAENKLEMGGERVATHVCRAHLVDGNGQPRPDAFCNEVLVLSRQKLEGKKAGLGPFITTKAIAHFSKKHESREVAAAAANTAKTLAFGRQNMMLAGGAQAGAAHTACSSG